MDIQVVPGRFSVCMVESLNGVDISQPFCFFARTDEEWSLTCETDRVPENTLAREDGWGMLRICGTLDFALIGILAGVSKVLADAGVGIFAVSTYRTDYILMKETALEAGLNALRQAGYHVLAEGEKTL